MAIWHEVVFDLLRCTYPIHRESDESGPVFVKQAHLQFLMCFKAALNMSLAAMISEHGRNACAN